jgi:hypothetical protein
MAKAARRKRKPATATRKRRGVVDLLDLPLSAFAAKPPPEPSPEELLEQEKAWETIRQAVEAWVQPYLESLAIRPVLKLPDDWASTPLAHKLSGKEWIPTAYARRPNELLAMTITEASHALADESAKIASDCAKPLKARYIEKRLRELGTFPQARRNPLRQRPK